MKRTWPKSPSSLALTNGSQGGFFFYFLKKKNANFRNSSKKTPKKMEPEFRTSKVVVYFQQYLGSCRSTAKKFRSYEKCKIIWHG